MANGALLAAVLLLFSSAVIHPNYLLYPTFAPFSDVTVGHWPKAHLMTQTWQATQSIPLWNPDILSGMPLAANQVAMRFYPPAWLFLVLPLNVVFNLLYVFHLFWGGLGVYWLMRTGFGLDPIPALASGLTFGLGSKLLAHVAGGHVVMAGAMAWMPWAVLGTHHVLHTGRLGWAGLGAVALAMQITTDVRILLFTSYLLIAYVCWECLVLIKCNRISQLRLVLPRLMIIPVLAALLGAAQLLPLVELASYSNRALSLAEAGEFALTPLVLLVGLLLPDTRGGHETVVYLGLVPMILAIFGFYQADTYPADRQGGTGRRAWFFVGVVLLTILYALGPVTPLFELVYRWVPGFRWVRAPARVFLPASLAVAVLAGIGLQRLARAQVRWSTSAALATGALTLGLGLGLVTLFGQINRAALGLALLPSLTLLTIGLTVSQRLAPRLALPGLTLLLFVDLASFNATMMRFVSPASAFAEGESVADYLVSQPGLFRTYSPSYSLPAHVAARAGLQTADGVDPVHLAAYDRLMALAGGYEDAGFSVAVPPFPSQLPLSEAFRNTQPDLRLLGLLNVEYLVAAFPMEWSGLEPTAEIEGNFVYRNRYTLPRAWVIPSSSVVSYLMGSGDDWSKQLTALATLAAETLTLSGSEAAVTHYEPDRIEAEVNLMGPGMLVLSEIWYPGWKAMVDGEVQPVEQVAGILRGVQLKPGSHHVVLVYDPASVRWGGMLSLVGWAGVAVGGIILLGIRVAGSLPKRRMNWRRWHSGPQ